MSKVAVLQLPPPGRIQGEEERLVDKGEIEAHLGAVAAHKSILGVRLDSSEEVFLSHILELVPSENYLVLDELAPVGGHLAVRAGSRFLVTARVTGALIRFYTEVISVGSADNLGYYKLHWPNILGVQQRRQHHRVFVPYSTGVPVLLSTDDDLSLRAELRDLSISGFSARLADGGNVRLRNGQVLPRCVLDLPELGRVSVPIEVRHLLAPNDERRAARLGARFLRVSPQDNRQLERMVRALERAAQRRQGSSAGAESLSG